QMIEKQGPWFENTIQNENDFKLIDEKIDVADRLSYVFEAIKLTKIGLDNRVPLIGFCGAPWIIFCYMVEGQGSKTFSKAKKLMVTNHQLTHQLLDRITTVTIDYLKLQIKAGADLVQVFDSWAGILSPSDYSEFGTIYVSRICDA